MNNIEEIMIKYPNFTIITQYDEMTLQPKTIVIDIINNKTYDMKTLWNWGTNNIDKFITEIITNTRNEKITNIIEPKS